MENNLIPFDLEKAKVGKPVVYRNGEVPKKLYFSNFYDKEDLDIISIDKENKTIFHFINGKNSNGGLISNYDLFIAEEEMYVVVFKDGSVFLYNELDRAKAYARNLANCKGTYKLVKI